MTNLENEKISGPLTLNLKKDDMICISGDTDSDLYIIHTGKLMVYVNEKTKITPLAYIGKGEYLGELSFFDGKPRSAHVVCLEDSTLIIIPVTEVGKQFPDWLITIAKDITANLRKTDEIIGKKGIRRKNVETIKPLSIEEQRHFYSLIESRV